MNNGLRDRGIVLQGKETQPHDLMELEKDKED